VPTESAKHKTSVASTPDAPAKKQRTSVDTSASTPAALDDTNVTTPVPDLPRGTNRQKPKREKKPPRPMDWSKIHRRRVALQFCYVGTLSNALFHLYNP
jgi:hypothetical protein